MLSAAAAPTGVLERLPLAVVPAAIPSHPHLNYSWQDALRLARRNEPDAAKAVDALLKDLPRPANEQQAVLLMCAAMEILRSLGPGVGHAAGAAHDLEGLVEYVDQNAFLASVR